MGARQLFTKPGTFLHTVSQRATILNTSACFPKALRLSFRHNFRRLNLGPAKITAMVLLMASLNWEVASGVADVTPKTDRQEAGLVGDVKTVITKEALLIETDHYDAAGRLLRRIEETSERKDMLGALTYLSTHDAEGKRVSESVQDGKGTIIKHTVCQQERCPGCTQLSRFPR